MNIAILLTLLVLIIGFLVAGLKTVPLGARGIVVTLDRRSGQLRNEGLVWIVPRIQRIERIYPRERQIYIRGPEYHTADRAKLTCHVTLRISVSDPLLLFDQGPGTYKPFTHEGATTEYKGDEEESVAIKTLVQNAVREVLQGLTMDQVMFGGGAGTLLREQIRYGLERTCQRWGLHLADVLVPSIDASSQGLRSAAESEVVENLKGRGDLAKKRAVVAQGAMFAQVAMDLGAEIQRRTGNAADLGAIERFLVQHYQNERALDVASKAAGHDNLLQQFYVHAFGAPMPQQMHVASLGGAFGGSSPRALGGSVRCGSCGATNPAGRFCDECGAPLSGQATQTGGAGGATGPGAGGWIIGREGDIVIDGAGVSRRHARLEVRGSSVVLTDLGSANGSYVHGSRLPPNGSTNVAASDSVRLGEHVWVQVSDLLRRVGHG